ncbi:MAG TPA: aspartate 1-decarboxylase [Legionellaceae bacterium]|nr:aspartate 1-decarboxylase [Legionellaceae bacterium]
MIRTMCKSKIHRAKVTDANLNYVGSITIDEALMEASDIIEFEEVHVLNINNGARFVTYALKGERDSGIICINGAAARLAEKDDLVIIASFAGYSEQELQRFRPKHIYVNTKNQILGDCRTIFMEQSSYFEKMIDE